MLGEYTEKNSIIAIALLVLAAALFILSAGTASAKTASCNANQTFNYTYYNPNSLQDNVRLTLLNSSDPAVDFSLRPGVFFFVYGGTNKTISITASSNHTTSGNAYVQVSKNGNAIAILSIPFSLSCENASNQGSGPGNNNWLRILEYIGIAIIVILIIGTIIYAIMQSSGPKKKIRPKRKEESSVSAKGVTKKEAPLPKPKNEKNKKVDVDKILKKYELSEEHKWTAFHWIMLALFVIFLIAIIIIAAYNMNFSLADITARGAANLTNATH